MRTSRAAGGSAGRIAGSALVIAVSVSASVLGTWSAFTATTASTGNTFDTGTVVITDDDDGVSPLLSFAGAAPGTSDTGCVRVTYLGSLPASVRLHGTTGGTGLDPYLQLTVTRGTGLTGTYDDCAGFTADPVDYLGSGQGVVYAGSLADFPDGWTGGMVDAAAGHPEVWTTDEEHHYRFQVTVGDDNDAQGKTATQTFTWEARDAGAYQTAVLADDPVAYWRLGEDAGTTAYDGVGGQHGTYAAGAFPGAAGATGDGDPAATFDGADDNVVVGDVFDFSGQQPFSAELWVRRSDARLDHYRGLVGKYELDGSGRRQGWLLTIAEEDDPDLRQRIVFERFRDVPSDQGSLDGTWSVTPLERDVWYHVVATYDGATMRVYVDGALEGSAPATMSLPDTTSPLLLADFVHGPYTSPYGGVLDDVAIYDYALTSAQVRAHHAAARR
jgi:hypothetical protein